LVRHSDLGANKIRKITGNATSYVRELLIIKTLLSSTHHQSFEGNWTATSNEWPLLGEESATVHEDDEDNIACIRASPPTEESPPRPP
jgi:hypothetical protein